jgi:hypothetical protein
VSLLPNSTIALGDQIETIDNFLDVIIILIVRVASIQSITIRRSFPKPRETVVV